MRNPAPEMSWPVRIRAALHLVTESLRALVLQEGCNNPGSLLQSSIYQLHKTEVTALIWAFYCSIKVTPPKKVVLVVCVVKTRGSAHVGRDLMTLVNKKMTVNLPIKQPDPAAPKEKLDLERG